MLVPALAFAWWLVSLPSPPAQEARVHPGARAPASETAPRGVDETEPTALDAAADEAASGMKAARDDGAREPERVAVKLVTPPIVQTARSLLDLPMGAERYATIEGRRYVFVLERHYHPPGFVGAPNGWHKGVTATSSADGRAGQWLKRGLASSGR